MCVPNQLEHLCSGGALLPPRAGIIGRRRNHAHKRALPSKRCRESSSAALPGLALIRHHDNVLYALTAAETDDESNSTRAAGSPDDREVQVEQRRGIRLPFRDEQLRIRVESGREEQSCPTASDAELPARGSSEPDADRVARIVSHRERVCLVIPRPSDPQPTKTDWAQTELPRQRSKASLAEINLMPSDEAIELRG
jgi:hypothetical protein